MRAFRSACVVGSHGLSGVNPRNHNLFVFLTNFICLIAKSKTKQQHFNPRIETKQNTGKIKINNVDYGT